VNDVLHVPSLHRLRHQRRRITAMRSFDYFRQIADRLQKLVRARVEHALLPAAFDFEIFHGRALRGCCTSDR
jgi:hypothetical protein